MALFSSDTEPALQNDHETYRGDATILGRPALWSRGFRPFFLGAALWAVAATAIWLQGLPDSERIARADAFFAALNIPIVTGGK
jgi:hypothetical protein